MSYRSPVRSRPEGDLSRFRQEMAKSKEPWAGTCAEFACASIAVDQWYANQKGEKESPVKQKGDKDYWTWLTANEKFTCYGSF
jgi:hypothetical protein